MKRYFFCSSVRLFSWIFVLLLTVLLWFGIQHTSYAVAVGYNAAGTTNYPNGGICLLDALPLNLHTNIGSMMIDEANGYAYVGTMTFPGQVIKIDLGSGTQGPTEIGRITLQSGEHWLIKAMIDTNNNLGYFLAYSNPARLIKVALGEGTNLPMRIGAVTFAAPEYYVMDGFIDAADGYGWFCTLQDNTGSTGGVIKVSLEATNSAPIRLGRLDFPPEEQSLMCGVADGSFEYGFFGTHEFSYTPNSTGRIVKVDLGSGTNLPTRVSVTVLTNVQNSFQTANFNPFDSYLYFSSTIDGFFGKLEPGSGTNPPIPVASTVLPAADRGIRACIIDADARVACFASAASPGYVVKVDLGGTSNAPARVGSLPPGYMVGEVAVDASSGIGYIAADSSDYKYFFNRIAVSHKSTIKGSLITLSNAGSFISAQLYSHQTGGLMRLAIYSNASPPTLLWQSSYPFTNSTAPAWMNIWGFEGSPSSLNLDAGEYWLAWQIDSPEAVTGYIEGGTNQGFIMAHEWGAFPADLSDYMLTNAVWGSAINYSPFIGSLQVDLTGGSASGQWRRVGTGDWYSSGVTETNIFVGIYTVECSDVSGWATPGNVAVRIADGVLTVTNAVYTQQTGLLKVDITGGNSGGMWRRVGEGMWRASGATETNILIGDYSVEFYDVSGWTTPSNVDVSIYMDTLTETNGIYVRQTGALQVTINGGDGDGRWRRVGESVWLTNNYTETGIPTGGYSVEFLDVVGWITPGDQFVSVTTSSTATTSGTYQPVGTLTVTIEPPEARTDGAQWSYNGFTWYGSGTNLTVAEDNYSILFREIIGGHWRAPTGRTVYVSQGSTGSTTGVYTPIGSLSVMIEGGDGNGRWRRVGETSWNVSGGTENGITAGTTQVEFVDVPLWVTPDTQSVSIVQGETTTATGTYIVATRQVSFLIDDTPGAYITGVQTQQVLISSNALPVTAVAPVGRHFSEWTYQAALYSTNNPLTVMNVTNDMDITAHFGTNHYAVQFETDGTPGATLLGDTNQLIAYGSSSTPVTVDYPGGALFRRWALGDATGPAYSTNNPVVVINVATDMILVAKFGVQFRVRSDAVPGGDGRTWTNAFRTVTNALAHVGEDDEIWVARGIYYPTAIESERGASFVLKDGIGLYGGFAGVETQRMSRNWFTNITVLSGDIDKNDYTDRYGISWAATNLVGTNAYHVVRAFNVDASAVLDGFYITGGNADAFAGDDRSAAGIWCKSNDGPTLVHLTVTGNKASGQGGGALIFESQPAIMNCAFRGNQAGSVGGGISLEDADADFRNVLFSVNRGNFGGGGLSLVNSDPSLFNCTIAGNESSDGWLTGGMHVDAQSVPVLVNCVLFTNRIYSWGPTSSVPVMTCCVVEGGYPGEGNLSSSPAFISPVSSQWWRPQSGGDYRLQSNSVGINAGTNLAWMTSTNSPASYDLNGNPRINALSGQVDMGAYEWPTGMVSTIDQSWLWLYGLDVDGSEDDVDTDGDMRTNWEEWYALTDPTNAASYFKVDDMRWQVYGIDEFLVIECESQLDRLYYLLWREHVMSGTWINITGSNIPGTGASISLVETNLSGMGPRGVYGIGISKP